MDHMREPFEVIGFPVQGPRQRQESRKVIPCDFVPLRLVLEDGVMAIELTEPDMVLGRHSDADIRLPLPDVSRRHCRFVFTAGHWQVIDLQSLNGVWVNNQPVLRSPLYQGDRVRVGAFVFTVELPSQAEAAEEARVADPPLYDLFRASLARSKPDPQLRRLAG